MDTKLEISFELNSKLDGINRAIDRVEKTEKAASRTSRTIGKMSKTFNNAGKRALQFGAIATTALFTGAGIFAKESFSVYADFEKKMKGVEAVLKPTSKQLGILSDEAKRLGRTTQFTTRESTSAIEILAKNGVKTEDILGGVLSASLSLSASVGAELPQASDTLTDALQVFSLKASQAQESVDSINSVVINSKFSFEDYSGALASGGASAVVAGQSFDEFNSTITATASFFASGETAGTAYKVFMDRLVSSSSEAKKAQKALGLEAFDASGKLKDISDIAGQLDRGLEKLSEEDRITALNKLFGTRGKNFAVALAKAGEEGIKSAEFLLQFADATAQAQKRLEGAEGSLTKFKSAFEGVKISVGEPLVDNITPFIDALTIEVSSFAGETDAITGVVNNLIDGVVNFAASGVDAFKFVRVSAHTLSVGILQIAHWVALGIERFFQFQSDVTSVFANVIIASSAFGNLLIKNILLPLNAIRKAVGKEEFEIKLPTEGLILGASVLAKASEEAVKRTQELSSITNDALEIGADKLVAIKQGLSGDDIRAKANDIKQSASLIRQASAELRDEERLFLDLQQGLQSAVTEKAPEEEISTLKKLITAQDEVVQSRKDALDKLRGNTEESQSLNRETANSADEIVKSVEGVAASADVSMDQAVAAFARLERGGSAHLQGLSKNLDSIKAKLSEVTQAGEQFEDDAVINSWLKDFALRGVDFLQTLSSKGFDPIKDKLGLITQVGESASNSAIGNFGSPSIGGFDNSSLAGIASGESSVAGIAGDSLSESDRIRNQYAEDRKVILEEESITAQQRKELLVGLEVNTQDALAQVQTQAQSDAQSRVEQNLNTTTGFLGDLTTIIFGEGKKAFEINKKIAIGQATVQGLLAVQNAWASAPFPFNLPAVAITGASTIANIVKISSQQPPSFISGGLVGGSLDPTRRSDNVLANVASGEFIVNPQSTASNLELLKGINSGSDPESLLNINRSLEDQVSLSPSIEVDVSTPPSQSGQTQDVNVLFDENSFLDRMEGKFNEMAVNVFESNKTRFGLAT